MRQATGLAHLDNAPDSPAAKPLNINSREWNPRVAMC